MSDPSPRSTMRPPSHSIKTPVPRSKYPVSALVKPKPSASRTPNLKASPQASSYFFVSVSSVTKAFTVLMWCRASVATALASAQAANTRLDRLLDQFPYRSQRYMIGPTTTKASIDNS